MVPLVGLASCAGSVKVEEKKLYQLEDINGSLESLVPTLLKSQRADTEAKRLDELKNNLATFEAKLKVLQTSEAVVVKELAEARGELRKRQEELERMGTIEESQRPKIEQMSRILQRFDTLRDDVYSSIQRYVDVRQQIQTHQELTLLAGLVEEARLGQFAAWVSEILLYIFGFKWF